MEKIFNLDMKIIFPDQIENLLKQTVHNMFMNIWPILNSFQHMVAAVRENRENQEISGEKIGQEIREMSGNFKVGQGKINGERKCNLKM